MRGKLVVNALFPRAEAETTVRQQRTERYLAARQRLRELCKNSKLTSDDFLEQRRKDKELEDRLDALHEEAAAKTAKRAAEGRRPFEGLRGSLQNSGVFSGDPVEIIRKMRDEW